LINAITDCPKGKTTINLKSDEHQIYFSIEGEGVGIPKTELYDIFSEFVVSSKTKSPAGNRGIGLAYAGARGSQGYGQG
jgi:signal transduction histidine kinase